MRVRSSVNAFWISRQKSSSSARSAGGTPATPPTVRAMCVRASFVSAGTTGTAAEAESIERRKRRRLVTAGDPWRGVEWDLPQTPPPGQGPAGTSGRDGGSAGEQVDDRLEQRRGERQYALGDVPDVIERHQDVVLCRGILDR